MSEPTLRPILATRVQRLSIPISITTGVLAALSTTLIAAGERPEPAGDFRLVIFGCVCFALAAGLGILREWAQRWVDKGQVAAAGQLRTAVMFALKPIATAIAQMQALTPKNKVSERRLVAQIAVDNMQLLFGDVNGLRSVVYLLRNPDLMEPLAACGRPDDPEPANFKRHPTGEPDPAFNALEANRSELVDDINDKTSQPDRVHGFNHGYRTFISVPIRGQPAGVRPVRDRRPRTKLLHRHQSEAVRTGGRDARGRLCQLL